LDQGSLLLDDAGLKLTIFAATDKGNPAQPMLFDFMEGGAGDE
jgi:hypothetical protein